jgi:hypothetical protein
MADNDVADRIEGFVHRPTQVHDGRVDRGDAQTAS